MQDKIKEIASRCKEMRELSDISVVDMAAKINVSAEYYRSFEDGNKDISASLLNEIAQALGVDLALLLTGKMPRMDIFSVTRKGKGVSVQRRQQYQYQALAANFLNKKAEPFLVTVQPKDDKEEISLNSHPGQEMDYVIAGTLKVLIHGNEIILEEGDTIFYDSSHPHGMAAVGDKPAQFIAIIM
ncbi:MAG: helix-turn-helix domain-containing protein [Lentisphaeria bacterium]|jgi:quercetin dioxygenase-like cupin family protein